MSVPAALLYANLPADGSKPFSNIDQDYSMEALLGPIPVDKRNYGFSRHIAQVKEVPSNDFAQLDTSGFQFVHAPTAQKSFEDDEAKLASYYNESIEIVKKVTGANRAVVFDHTIRRNIPGEAEGPKSRHPVPLVHVDQTPESSEARVKRHLPEADVPGLLNKRFQIINLWRPIHNKAIDWPLALCDYTTVDAENELIRSTLLYPDRTGETFSVKFSDRHQWYYKKEMTPDDIVLIKCYDSKDGVAKFTPHTAFEDTTAPPDAPRRESIEIRLLVFYP